MRRPFIALLILLTLVPLASARTRSLKSFDALMAALKRGESVRVVVDYGRCALMMDGEEVESVDAVGGMPIEAWEHFAAGVIGNDEAYLAFSENKLIGIRGFVYNYARFRVYADGAVRIRAQYLKPADFEIVMDEEFVTSIGDAANFYIQR